MKKTLRLAFLAAIGLMFAQISSAQVVKELTFSEFNKRIAKTSNTREWKFLGDKPAIIDFYATWCGPCKKLSPALEELAKEYEGRIDIYKIDIDKNKSLASLFSIRSVPTIFFVPMDKQPAVVQGAIPKTEIKRIIDSTLLK